MQLTRMLDQLSTMSTYANDIISGMVTASSTTNERVNELQARLEVLKGNAPIVDEKLENATIAELLAAESELGIGRDGEVTTAEWRLRSFGRRPQHIRLVARPASTR